MFLHEKPRVTHFNIKWDLEGPGVAERKAMQIGMDGAFGPFGARGMYAHGDLRGTRGTATSKTTETALAASRGLARNCFLQMLGTDGRASTRQNAKAMMKNANSSSGVDAVARSFEPACQVCFDHTMGRPSLGATDSGAGSSCYSRLYGTHYGSGELAHGSNRSVHGTDPWKTTRWFPV